MVSSWMCVAIANHMWEHHYILDFGRDANGHQQTCTYTDMYRRPGRDVLQAGSKAQGVVHVIISQAALLLELMRSTLALSSQPAGSLVACTTILSKLSACQVSSGQPAKGLRVQGCWALAVQSPLRSVDPDLCIIVRQPSNDC